MARERITVGAVDGSLTTIETEREAPATGGWTAGEWTVRCVTESGDTLAVYIECNGLNIARVFYGMRDRETTDANARLIAATPAMPSALQAFVDLYPGTMLNRDVVDPGFCDAVDAARALLARVRGEGESCDQPLTGGTRRYWP